MSNYIPGFSRGRRYTPRPNASPETVAAWKEANPEAAEWIERKATQRNDFACSLLGGLNRYGSLTEGQVAAVRKCIARDAQQEQRHANAPTLNIAAIGTAFERAREAGVRSPKLMFARFKFVGGRQRDTVLIYDRETGGYYGRITNGRLLAAASCTPEIEREIVTVAQDPHNAAIAYGKQFGVCSACSRTLTDPNSVARSIGPVCEKLYFGA